MLATPAAAAAQVRAGDSYAVTAWSPDAGLPAPLDTVFAMAQDEAGYLWLGTRSGLIRFDGSQFFPWGGRGEAPLPGRSVRALTSSRDGSLWVTFADANGVTRIQHGKVLVYSEQHGLPAGLFSSVLEDRHGAVWAAGRAGLVRLADQRWLHVGPQQGLDATEAFSIHEDSGGRLWVGTSQGVFRRSEPDAPFEAVDRSLTHAEGFAESSSGAMWVTDSRHVVRSINSTHALDYAPGLPSPAAGWRLVADRRGGVWIAALGNGLLRVRVEPVTGRHVLEPFIGTRIRGSVQSLFRDREDNLWVGMRDGLLRLSESFVDTSAPLEGLTDEGVRALAVSTDGSVWAATTYGLNRFRGQRRDVYDQTQTMALHADPSGSVWIATTEGISRFDGDRLVRVASAALDRVGAMTTDREGGPWLCSGPQGVHRLYRGALVRAEAETGFPQKPCATVYTDRRGRLWVGFTTGGVAVNDSASWQTYAEHDGLAGGRVYTIIEDRGGAIWFSTVKGLSRFVDGRFTTIGERNGLPEQLERSMVEDDDGHIWLTVNGGSGIIRFDAREMDKVAADPAYRIRYALYDKSDGFPSVLPFWSPAAARDDAGRLWFATGAGLAIVDVGLVPTDKPPVSPRIESVIADGVAMTPDQSLRLATDTSNLQIDYAALSLSAGTKLRFRYMLEGANTDWVYAGIRRQALFTNLEPGHYRFRISATSDGLWTEPEAVWAFSLPPPFYRTVWFYALWAIAVASAIWAYWLLSIRAVSSKYRLILAERARVSREIHDTLLQSLGAVGIELEVVASHLNSPGDLAGTSLQRLRARVQQCVTDARQSIWELRTPGLDTRDLTNALQDLADDTNWDRPVNITVTSASRSRPCSPQAQEQLIRIVREAITNAVRHGHAEHVEVTVSHRHRFVSVRVSDDGVGFVPGEAPRSGTHCGLASMKERAERVGGHLKIVSGVGAGAVVEAQVPVS